MKIRVNEEGNICLEEIYNPIELRSDNEVIVVCQRDGRFEVYRYEAGQKGHSEDLAVTVPVIERLEALLGEWLYDGRFSVANSDEDIDLCKRTYDTLSKIEGEYTERRW